MSMDKTNGGYRKYNSQVPQNLACPDPYLTDLYYTHSTTLSVSCNKTGAAHMLRLRFLSTTGPGARKLLRPGTTPTSHSVVPFRAVVRCLQTKRPALPSIMLSHRAQLLRLSDQSLLQQSSCPGFSLLAVILRKAGGGGGGSVAATNSVMP